MELSEYEQQRLLNIERNNAILKDLKIDKLPVAKVYILFFFPFSALLFIIYY